MRFLYRIERVPTAELDRVEISVLWHTEGKGDEDFAVHAFWEIPTESLRSVALDSNPLERPFSVALPFSPLSYEGRLLRIRWCVRLRLYLSTGEEIVVQQPFYLGPLTKDV